MKITVELSGDLQRALTRSRRDVDSVAGDGMIRIGEEFVAAASKMAGPGAYGRSFRVDQTRSLGLSGMGIEAGSISPLAAILERGRRPGHAPSPQALAKRSRTGAGGKSAMAKRIAERGTKGMWVVKKANAQIRNDGTIERIARDTLVHMASLGRTDGSI